MTSEGGWGGNGRLRCHIAANTAAAEHFKPSSRLSLNSQQLNLGDGKRAQSGEKSVPDDFLLFCSFSSALTPLFPHLSYRPNAPMSSLCLPLPAPHLPSQHSYSRALPTPETKRPGNHSVAQVISGACLASPPPLQPPRPPFFYFPASLHPCAPPVHSSMTNHMGFH